MAIARKGTPRVTIKVPSSPAGFCYIDHSKSPDHPYYDDHMNAHIRTPECDKPRRKTAADRWRTAPKALRQVVAKIIERERGFLVTQSREDVAVSVRRDCAREARMLRLAVAVLKEVSRGS